MSFRTTTLGNNEDVGVLVLDGLKGGVSGDPVHVRAQYASLAWSFPAPEDDARPGGGVMVIEEIEDGSRVTVDEAEEGAGSREVGVHGVMHGFAGEILERRLLVVKFSSVVFVKGNLGQRGHDGRAVRHSTGDLGGAEGLGNAFSRGGDLDGYTGGFCFHGTSCKRAGG